MKNSDLSEVLTSDRNEGWNSINWNKAEKYVRRMQARIVKAELPSKQVVKPALSEIEAY